MARLNATDSEEVKLEKLRVDLEKYRILQAHITRRILWVGCFAAIWVGIIAWAIVRMNDKPAWLEFGLAIVGLFSGQTFLLIWVWRRLGQALIAIYPRPPVDPDAPDRIREDRP